ncbi:MAG TPA: hypothetical protein VNK24_03625 [Elusimicrobiota bacterium]|nr:hypothetical protein [Elusimicrobiota bacterium]
MRRGEKIAAFLLAALAAVDGPALAGPKARPGPKAVIMVESFLKTPVSDLPPGQIDAFLKINPEALPRRLRDPYEAKKAQLEALRKVYEIDNRGPRPGAPAPKGCSIPIKGDEALVGFLKKGGFVEITRLEKDWLAGNTHCSPKELMCQFSLTIVQRPGAKKIKPETWYLLHEKDPLFMLVDMKRQGQVPQTSGSFGESSFPTCR